MRIVHSIICVLVFVLYGCAGVQAGEPVDLRYAKGFQVKKQGELTLVTVSNPWSGAKVVFKYLLKPRGRKTPSGYADCQVVEVPVRTLVTLSSPCIAFIEQLGLADQLIGLSDAGRVHSLKIRSQVQSGKLVEVSRNGHLQVESVLDLSPDIIFSFGTGSIRDAHPKLLEAGLRVGVVAEYMEEHPLGRSEWIKFFALFTGKEERAREVFDQLEQRYLNLAEMARSVAKRPTVITGAPFAGRWYVSGGRSYLGRLFQDAGASYVFKETRFKGSQPMDIELVYARGLGADYWVNTGVWTTLAQAREADPRFAAFPSLQHGRLFNNNRRINQQGGNDYWESGVMAPDRILADIIHILHPELLPDHTFVYYTQLR